jgi:hypothetical protein
MEKQSSASSNNASDARVITLRRLDDSARSPLVGDKVPFAAEAEGALVSIQSADSKDARSSLQDKGWMFQPSQDPAVSFYLVPLKGGSLEVPALQMQGSQGLYTSEAFQLETTSAYPKGKESEKPPEWLPPVAMEFPAAQAAFLGVFIAIVLAALFTWAYRFWKKRKPASPGIKEPALTPHEMALKRFQQLQKEQLPQKGRFKPHYFGVSEILKEFFERVFGFQALESTTGELLEALRLKPLSSYQLRKIEELFQVLDLVKFTDYQPQTLEADQVLSVAREIVHEIKPVEGSGGPSAV